MSLLDELKSKRLGCWQRVSDASERITQLYAEIEAERAKRIAAYSDMEDIDTALSALGAPQPERVPLDDGEAMRAAHTLTEGATWKQSEPIATEVRTQAEGEAADDFDDMDDDEEFDEDDDEEDREPTALIISAIPDGFTPHTGEVCPIDPLALIDAVFADHQNRPNHYHLGDAQVAGEMNWNGKQQNDSGHPQCPVIAYRIIKASETASELRSEENLGGDREDHNQPALTDTEFQSLESFKDEGLLDDHPEAASSEFASERDSIAGIDKDLIAEDIPTIPRSEIPEGSALETFADSGLETVRTPSGITHIITDDAAAIAEAAPEAVYAPIHEAQDEPHELAQVIGAGINRDIDQKAEAKPGVSTLFAGLKRALVGEGV